MRCEYIDMLEEKGWKKGWEEGRARGIIEIGYEYGRKESDILNRLQERLNISMDRAREYLDKFKEVDI